MKVITPLYDWGYVSGTRRTVLENFDGGFYGSNAFRKQHEDSFRGKLGRAKLFITRLLVLPMMGLLLWHLVLIKS